jgi:hypothetical protein
MKHVMTPADPAGTRVLDTSSPYAMMIDLIELQTSFLKIVQATIRHEMDNKKI